MTIFEDVLLFALVGLCLVVLYRWRLNSLQLARMYKEVRTRQEELELIADLAVHNEERFRRLVDASFEGIALLGEGKILDANPAFSSIFGYELYEVIGMRFADFFSDPDDFATIQEDTNTQRLYEVRGVRKDQQPVTLEIRLRTLSVSPYSAQMVTLQDITQRVQTEAILRQQALMYENITDSVFLTDKNGFITDCNPATEKLFGYTKAELIGKTPQEIWFVHPEITSDGSIRGAMLREGRWVREIEFKHKDGKHGFLEVIRIPIFNEQGEVMATLGVNHDITVFKEANQAMREAKEAAESANHAKSAFLANMSHELRTPLNAIIGYSELLQEEVAELGEPMILADVQKIGAASRHLLSMISDVLDLAKIEAGRMKLTLNDFNIPRMLDEIIATVQPLIERNQNILHLDLPPENSFMYGDEVKVRQVILNMLSNAAKFTRAGRIHLSVQQENGIEDDTELWYRIKVMDTGIGIDPTKVADLFDPFTQADSSSTRQFEGTGLGLTITRHFCHMLGGTIVATGEVGKGSSFTVWLPAKAQVPEAFAQLIERG